ncbi:glutathione-disulfide reductase [Acaryochloris sp. IP29b_bin.137]|uniref:glutathione-disulfide reductase n=1 Tax=Acaryochloris sp. IP29b_bin.137 TaxID=2969217 RepID=UPI00261174A2|nr:glutathione-disulfide reductase [Acaryochloris sp. IP29b_bin.137]
MTYDYDLLVIGAGSGGLAAAKRAARYGAKVGIIENDLVGGTCVVRGCVPKKLLVYASQFSHLYQDAVGYGWDAITPSFHWPTLAQIVDNEVNRLSQLHTRFLDQSKVELILGQAAFLDSHIIEVHNSSASHDTGKRKLTAERILIATGSEAVLPDIPGIELALTSREVFKLPKQPKKLAIIGGGYIGVEFAGIFNGLVTEVIQIVRGDNILRGFDEDIRTHLQDTMRQRGITILTETQLDRLEKTTEGTVLFLKGDAAPATLTVDAAVLFAIGRVPNTADLGLDLAGVAQTDHGAVAVNEWSQTTQPHIYAVGDVTNRANLTPVAIDEGRAFADTVFGNTPRAVNYANIPTAVFSQPEVATVGLSEAEAIVQLGEKNVKIYRSTFRPLYHSLTGATEKTVMKLVVDQQSNRVIGAHMVGKEAAEIIQSVAISINMGATKQDFDNTMALHPSTAEEFVTMR